MKPQVAQTNAKAADAANQLAKSPLNAGVNKEINELEIAGEENLIPNDEEPFEHEHFLINPEMVKELWESSRPKSRLIEIYQKMFKPKNPLDDEPMEYNELNIISEFQIKNLVFAKNELLLDDIQTSYLLALFWDLLAINNDGTRKECYLISSSSDDQNSLSKDASHNSADYKHAFDTMLIHRFRQGVFKNTDKKYSQILKIADHANKIFFKHFLLYDFVLNNKKVGNSQIKQVHIPKDRPKIAPSLNEALSLVKDQSEIDDGEEQYDQESDY